MAEHTIEDEIALRAGKLGMRVDPRYDLADQPEEQRDLEGHPVAEPATLPIDPRYDINDQPDVLLDQEGHPIEHPEEQGWLQWKTKPAETK